MEVKELVLKHWRLRSTGSTMTERMLRTARTMAEFSDLELRFASEPGSIVLCQEELNLVINTVLTGLSVMADIPDYGSLVLCSQGVDGKLIWLLQANLRNGPSNIPASSVIEYDKRGDEMETRSSRVEAVNVVQDVLNHGRKTERSALRALDLPEEEELDGRIYIEKDAIIDTENVLVANSDNGRYIAVYLGCRIGMPSAYPLAMVMQTLACLRKDDAKLQESAALVETGVKNDNYGVAASLMRDISLAFADGTDSMLREWQEWQKAKNKEG